ncbi:Bacterial regulatory proteins, tetR family [Variovorax sp. PBS-H4]|uniref:TetR/AcrR family transcriptional regulator n=1 Tax=Variovorax sp. PBS-H4 TaxID=434008 RepID=UPI001315C0CA|nr:TetR/AcrR family transcriptional regulator [Variovorax sp. PBS-H4]VTU28371.1 Bacterial regulatory proteins, tetR family [Variovorax sp. PBS-H4]
MSQPPRTDAPAAGPRRRTGGRSARVMAAVADAVMSELTESGLGAFSIPKVAVRSGVSRSSIYRRWQTKTDLITFAAIHHIEEAIPMPDLGSLRADLLRIVEEVAVFVTQPASKALFAIAFGPNTAESDSVQNALWHMRTERHQAVFDRALARGEISHDTDTGEIIERAIGPIYIRTFLSRRPVTPDFLERLLDGTLPSAPTAKRR